MAKYDVVVIGAGAAGLSAGALLARQGKKVVVIDRDKHLGGRAMAVPYEGYRLNLGGHLLEDDGYGITKIIEYVGGKLEHGLTSQGMPVWHQGGWKAVQELYSADKNELKKVIKILCETPWSEFDKYDHLPLRAWLEQHTKSEGVIALFEWVAMAECLTENWWDHAASDNLYVRKMHYMHKRIAGYSCWPVGGWDGMFRQLADGIKRHGGEVMMETAVRRVVFENRRVKGVLIERGSGPMASDAFNWEPLECEAVISTLPVWNVLDVVRPKDLPDWYVGQIRHLAQDAYKVCWVGMYVACHEPIFTGIHPTELALWFDSPHSRLPGWAFLATGYDPSVAPAGTHLYNCGFAFQGTRSQEWYEQKFNEIEKDLEAFYPKLFTKKNVIWKRRHLIANPAFGVFQKPGLVGVFRPDYTAPGVEGLYFASETFRSRGIGVDRAARAGLTCAEKYLGTRIPEFKDSWHD